MTNGVNKFQSVVSAKTGLLDSLDVSAVLVKSRTRNEELLKTIKALVVEHFWLYPVKVEVL